ncbi:hypothetical protein V8C35DRAFT_331673 [Trichoderma chlorosporum]
MPESPDAGRLEVQEEEAAYPPCLFASAEEKRLYQRLKDAYLANYSTWDTEARQTWPYIIEHASLAPSTINKITNHAITRHMTNTRVTWGHVVALRVIYKARLFKSKKLMRLIRGKYPRANFNSYAYSEEYTRPFDIKEEEKKSEEIVQKNNPKPANNPPDTTNNPVENISPTAPPPVKEAINRFLNEREDSQSVEETDGLYFTSKPKNVPVKAEEQSHPVSGVNENNARVVPHPTNKRKRATTQNASGNRNAERNDARKPPARRRDKNQPQAAAHGALNQAAIQNEIPAIMEVAEGSPSSKKDHQDKNTEWFKEALASHGKSLSENTKAAERNTRALEKNSELLKKLTEQLLNRRQKTS